MHYKSINSWKYWIFHISLSFLENLINSPVLVPWHLKSLLVILTKSRKEANCNKKRQFRNIKWYWVRNNTVIKTRDKTICSHLTEILPYLPSVQTDRQSDHIVTASLCFLLWCSAFILKMNANFEYECIICMNLRQTWNFLSKSLLSIICCKLELKCLI